VKPYTRSAVHSKRSRHRSLHLKPAWLEIALRNLTALDTEKIVRRDWERYARLGHIAGSEPHRVPGPIDSCRLLQPSA
jgi:hypothetical protein